MLKNFAPPSHRRSAERGFTMLEVTIVATLLSILLLVLLRWVGSLGTAAGVGVELTSATRDLNYAAEAIRNDINQAEGCAANGMDVPLRQITPTTITLYRQISGRSTLVLWRLAGPQSNGYGLLQRAEVDDDGNCGFNTTTPAWKTVLDKVVMDGSTVVFVPIQLGQRRTDNQAYGDCTGEAALACLYSAIEINLAVAGGSEGSTTIARTVVVAEPNLSSSRLGRIY